MYSYTLIHVHSFGNLLASDIKNIHKLFISDMKILLVYIPTFILYVYIIPQGAVYIFPPGPVAQSIVSLTKSSVEDSLNLPVLTKLNWKYFFAEKSVKIFCTAKALLTSHFFGKNGSILTYDMLKN